MAGFCVSSVESSQVSTIHVFQPPILYSPII